MRQFHQKGPTVLYFWAVENLSLQGQRSRPWRLLPRALASKWESVYQEHKNKGLKCAFLQSLWGGPAT